MNKQNFALTVNAVMGALGISSFCKNAEGKSILTSDQKKKLGEKWGDKFVEAFEADLAELEADGSSAEDSVAQVSASVAQQTSAADAQAFAEIKAEIKKMNEKISKMGKSPVDDTAQTFESNQPAGAKPKFVPDMSLLHNRNYYAATGDAWTGDTTVNTEELKREFGKYVSADKYQIFAKLVGHTESTKFMSAIITDKFEYRATKSHMTSVLQTFTPQFTPKGKATFTPMTIRQYPMKINVAIIPSDIINDVLGYLYDESLEPKDMPIVRYIVEVLIKPKLDEERETAFAVGRYVEPTLTEDGKYKPNESNQVMDGYLTQLCDLKKASDPDITWLLSKTPALGTGNTLLDNIDKAVDEVSALYANHKMFIHADPLVVRAYGRAYRDKYKDTKNEDGEMLRVDFSKFSFAPLEGMRGSGAFFITPKENFKHMMSRDPKNANIRMTSDDYTAKVLSEWREGVGFLIKEAIFAYIPAALVEKLSPTLMVAETGNDEGGI